MLAHRFAIESFHCHARQPIMLINYARKWQQPAGASSSTSMTYVLSRFLCFLFSIHWIVVTTACVDRWAVWAAEWGLDFRSINDFHSSIRKFGLWAIFTVIQLLSRKIVVSFEFTFVYVQWLYHSVSTFIYPFRYGEPIWNDCNCKLAWKVTSTSQFSKINQRQNPSLQGGNDERAMSIISGHKFT